MTAPLPLPKIWNLPTDVARAFGGLVREQRSLLLDEHLLLVVHTPADANHRALFLRTPTAAWKSTEGGAGLPHLHGIVDAYEMRSASLGNELAKATVARHFYDLLGVLRSKELRAREMAFAVGQASDLVPADAELDRLAVRARGAAARLALLVRRAEDGRSYDLAQLAEEQADISNQMVVSSQRLNFLIAMLLPMTAFASIFGMNLFSGVDRGSSALFWTIVVFSILLGAVLSFFVGRMPRQLRRESHLEQLVSQLEARAHAAAEVAKRS